MCGRSSHNYYILSIGNVIKLLGVDSCLMHICWDSLVGSAVDTHATGPGFNTHSQLNLAGS